ncbi:Asp/Glu racemase [Maribius pontilimi]|uniref:Asp/Glu racemase n=1 Tax=Palleronia pontilimi TaxID=1964209 RepID=A0A934MD98_9RHOB|nr:Asp/Glu racemase [Palleronia pontilimi]MBJ3763305.1 Asp/Glu racemase [Palleronia pontilimi]
MILQPRFRDTARTALGLVVLSAEETLERVARAAIPPDTDLFVSRVPSGTWVTPDTLAAMEADLPAAASLFPAGRKLDAVGYACTSGAARIGPARVAEILKAATGCPRVTDPLSALITACRARKLTRLGIVSPYTEDVSDFLRRRLSDAGIATPAFASFDTAEETKVARITPDAIAEGAIALAGSARIDAVFLSCTNLDTADARPQVTRATGLPCLCSNSVLLDHLLALGAG